MPADIEEEFLRHVLDYERAEPISLLRLLENAGLEIPAPDQLDDITLTSKLKEMIQRMAPLVGPFGNHLARLIHDAVEFSPEAAFRLS